MAALKIDRARLRGDLDALASFGANAHGGVDRPSYSEADTQARRWLVERAREAGLPAREDGLGNLFLRLEPEDASAAHAAPVWTGSHLDAVPDGGRFDGAAGVLAALEVLRRLREEHVPLARPVDAVVWTDEEGCYQGLLGSSTLVHGLSSDELDRIVGRDGRTLREALAASGRDPAAAVRDKQSDLPHCYLELHIEQGPSLERAGADVGVVTGIVGLAHGQAAFHGRADHAGTTPLDARQDALRAASAFVLRLPQLPGEAGLPDAVLTCGDVRVLPGADNIVPAEATCRLDVRDADRSALAGLQVSVADAAHGCAAAAGVTAEVAWEHVADPVAMDADLRGLLASVADTLGYRHLSLPSRAGHDAQNVAALAPAAMVFVPSQDGRSHCPEEYTDPEQLARGADVLLGAVAARATERTP